MVEIPDPVYSTMHGMNEEGLLSTSLSHRTAALFNDQPYLFTKGVRLVLWLHDRGHSLTQGTPGTDFHRKKGFSSQASYHDRQGRRAQGTGGDAAVPRRVPRTHHS